MTDLLDPALSALDAVLATTGRVALLSAALLYVGYLLASAVALVGRAPRAPRPQPVTAAPAPVASLPVAAPVLQQAA